jgi:hypothetical protein
VAKLEDDIGTFSKGKGAVEFDDVWVAEFGMELEFGYKLLDDILVSELSHGDNRMANLLNDSPIHLTLDNLKCNNLARWLVLLA